MDRKRNVILSVLFFILFVFPISVYAAPELEEKVAAQDNQQQKILQHIYLDNMDLSGLTMDQARERVIKRMEEITGYQIILHMDDEKIRIQAKDLGVYGDNEKVLEQAADIGQSGNVIKRFIARKDLEKTPVELDLCYQVDEERIREVLESECVPKNRKVRNYGLSHTDGVFAVNTGRRGIVLDEEASVEVIKQYLTKVWRDGIGEVDLPVEITEPGGSQEELARVKDVLGSGSTIYSESSSARKANIKNGTIKLDGTVIYPGETFSVCDAMVPFSAENGYELAPSYENGEVVDSYGGGICQVSTTLYLAVLRAELEVVERYSHSMLVKYVKPSMDAAIAEGSKDFKFRNNLDIPIYIEGYANGSEVGFSIYGEEYRPEGRSVTYQSETIENTESTTELVPDYDMAFGKIETVQAGHNGCVAHLWKIVTENGQENKEEANKSRYDMSPGKYKVGMKTSSEAASRDIQSAVSSGSLSKVYDVIHAY